MIYTDYLHVPFWNKLANGVTLLISIAAFGGEFFLTVWFAFEVPISRLFGAKVPPQTQPRCFWHRFRWVWGVIYKGYCKQVLHA